MTLASRSEAIERYRRWLLEEIRSGRMPLQRLAALHRQRLGCWCAPEPCHGEVLEAAAAQAAAQLRRSARPS